LLTAAGGGYNVYIYNEAAGNYGVYNDNSLVDEGTNGTSRYIAPMQGFFVAAKTGTLGSGLGFDNAARVHSSQGWLKSDEGLSIRLKVSAPENAGSDEAMIEFGQSTSIGGAEKWNSFMPTAPGIYMPKDSKNFSINFLSTISENPEIPVSFKAGVAGTYSLTATFEQSAYGSVKLYDLKAGYEQDLKNNPVYSFAAGTDDDANRFVLKFSGVGIDAPEINSTGIYSIGNRLFIQNPGMAKLEVYNLSGQRIMDQEVNGNGLYQTSVSVATGYYVVRLTTSGNVRVSKVFIQ
jgi:hypothetical protein